MNPALYLGESSKYEINKELDSACQYSTAGSPSLCNEYSLGVYETQHLPTAQGMATGPRTSRLLWAQLCPLQNSCFEVPVPPVPQNLTGFGQ